MLEMRCKTCHQSVKRLMLLALIEDAGAHVYPSATKCWDGKEHEFEDLKDAIKETLSPPLE